MSQINFPGNAADGSTFFHGDNVCVYHADIDTWECRSVVDETPQSLAQNSYITTNKVYTLGEKREEWQSFLAPPLDALVTNVTTQERVNDVIINLLKYIHDNSGSAATVDYATEDWVTANYAPLAHNHDADYAPVSHTHTDHPTRAEFDALVATVSGNFNTLLAAITGS